MLYVQLPIQCFFHFVHCSFFFFLPGCAGSSLWCESFFQLLCWGLVDPWHVGSSQTSYQTFVPWIARQIFNHWTSREAPVCPFHFLFLCTGSLLLHGLSPVVGSRGYSLVSVCSLFIVVASLVLAPLLSTWGSRCSAFSSCSTWVQ